MCFKERGEQMEEIIKKRVRKVRDGKEGRGRSVQRRRGKEKEVMREGREQRNRGGKGKGERRMARKAIEGKKEDKRLEKER